MVDISALSLLDLVRQDSSLFARPVFDLFLVGTCMFSGALGSIAYFLVLISKFSADGQNDIVQPEVDVPNSQVGRLLSRSIKLVSAFLAHTALGVIIGFMVGLAFFGTMQAEPAALARLAFACILLGYQAPKIWSMQEKVVNKAVESRLTGLLETLSTSLKQAPSIKNGADRPLETLAASEKSEGDNRRTDALDKP